MAEVLFWSHICTELDLDRALIRTSVNGRPAQEVDISKMTGPLPRLFLSLGVVHHNWDTELHQFLGKVTNIRLYRGLAGAEVEEMTRSPCLPSSLQTFLLWEQMDWEVSGEAELETLQDSMFCSERPNHPVLLPTPMSYQAAKDACFKLGGGTIAEPASVDGVSIGETCRFIWTPYTDAETEGTFVNDYTGEVVR